MWNLHAKSQISLAAAVVAPGLMVLAIILFMGAVSGAHLNPGRVAGIRGTGRFPLTQGAGLHHHAAHGRDARVPVLLAVFGNVEHLGATLPGPGYHDWQSFLMEIALTAVLVSVILGTASAAQNVGAIGALGVGDYIALAGLWSAPVSGTSMNPARSFAPALVSGDWTEYWVYVVGPLVGAGDRGRVRDHPARPRLEIRSPMLPDPACSLLAALQKRPSSPKRSTKERSSRPASTSAPLAETRRTLHDVRDAIATGRRRRGQRVRQPARRCRHRRGWVVVGCMGYSRAGAGALVFSNEAPDVLWGLARCVWSLGALPELMVWDREGRPARRRRPSDRELCRVLRAAAGRLVLLRTEGDY